MFKRGMRCILLLLIFLGTQIIHIHGWEIDQISSVTRVIDGDTFYLTGDKVRLADIDAQENGNEPGFSIAKYALSSLVGGKTVYLDTDQKSGRDQYGRLVVVVYVKVNSTHYLNMNKALLIQGVVVEDDYLNNEFTPSTWTLYVKYADPASNIGPVGPQGIPGIQGPQGIQGPPGEPASNSLLFLSLVISILSLLLAIFAIVTSRHHLRAH
jgi:hypothetical protein